MYHVRENSFILYPLLLKMFRATELWRHKTELWFLASLRSLPTIYCLIPPSLAQVLCRSSLLSIHPNSPGNMLDQYYPSNPQEKAYFDTLWATAHQSGNLNQDLSGAEAVAFFRMSNVDTGT